MKFPSHDKAFVSSPCNILVKSGCFCVPLFKGHELHRNCWGRDWNCGVGNRSLQTSVIFYWDYSLFPLSLCLRVFVFQLQLEVPETEGRMIPLGGGLEPNHDIWNTKHETQTVLPSNNSKCKKTTVKMKKNHSQFLNEKRSDNLKYSKHSLLVVCYKFICPSLLFATCLFWRYTSLKILTYNGLICNYLKK